MRSPEYIETYRIGSRWVIWIGTPDAIPARRETGPPGARER